ncbi:MAG: glycosyltransferase family 4 protein [Pyrinomonadaceae bacterium]
MKICFIADARSPIALNWINYYIDRGDQVQVVSSYPCSPDELPGAVVHQVLLAFAGFSRVGHDGTVGRSKRRSVLTPILASLRSGSLAISARALRHWLSPLDLGRHVYKVRRIIMKMSPDIVHAMRVPFEGIIAARSMPPGIPLLVSVWGNDFTLFAKRNALVGRQTRQTIRATSALHCDCQRDLHLAESWGFDTGKPSIVLPGAGGIQTNVFKPRPLNRELLQSLEIPPDAKVIINPRGFRDYVRNDVFFQSIPYVLKECGNVVFLCSAMKGNSVAEKWLSVLGIAGSVRLLPLVSREQMAELFSLASVMVSPSLHDGTPNTLLEALASGCFPVAGNIESVREWITDGVNGFLCDPNDPKALAKRIVAALNDDQRLEAARRQNIELVTTRADYRTVMAQSERFYEQVIASSFPEPAVLSTRVIQI